MNTCKILIVEDELIVSKSITLSLEQEGYTCISVTSGEEAIERVPLESPNLILMDIGLSGKVDGITTAGIIRQSYNLPVIFITDQKNYQIYKQALQMAPDDYISKPFTDISLVKAVREAMTKTRVPDLGKQIMTTLDKRVEDGIFVFYNKGYQKVLFADILYLEADGAYTNIYCNGARNYNISLSSNNVVAQLDCPAIVKTARSYYVNIHRIDKIKTDSLLIGTTAIPMHDAFKQDVLSRFKLLTKRKLPFDATPEE